MSGPERREVLDLLGLVRSSSLGDHVILAGSSGLYGVSETLPAFRDTVDRIGGSVMVPVMVFGDLSTLLTASGSTVELAQGGRGLSAAALAASKLLTIRLEKGGKDKVQALLLITENAQNQEFLSSLGRLLSRFDRDRVEDALADAQAASMALSRDVLSSDSQTSGYAEMSRAVHEGLALLQQLTAGAEP